MLSGRRHTVLPALVVAALGIFIAMFGYLRSVQPLTPTTGVITESAMLGGMKSSIWRNIHYTYRVASRKYAAQATVKNSLAHDAPYRVGAELPVFFVSSAPERSYAFGPPMALPWVTCGTVLVLIGGIIVFFAWNA